MTLPKSHTIKNFEQIDWNEPIEKDLFEMSRSFSFPQPGNDADSMYKNKLRIYSKGQAIKIHSHSIGRVYKIIINPTGKVKYGINDGNEEQIFQFGEIAWVEKDQEYDSIAESHTIMILIEPKLSTINYR